MLLIRTHLGWDGITFALDPLTRRSVEERYPDAYRASRVFVGTEDARPTDVRLIGGLVNDPDGKLKIVAEMLTGGLSNELLPLSFRVYPEEEVHRVE